MNHLLIEAFVFLAAAIIAVPISKRLGLGSVLGYLIAGIVIGPVLGLVGEETDDIQHVAEFGVVMMLFLVGLELEPRKLYALRHKLLGLGGLQAGLTILVFFGVGVMLDLPWSVALAVAMILCLSSTAIVLQTLSEKGLMTTSGGRSSFAVLLFQDIAVIPMLAFIPLLALPTLTGNPDSAHGHNVSIVEDLLGWQRALITALSIASIILMGRYLVRPVFRFIARTRLREMFTAFALLLVVGISALMAVIGLSAALGTFLAGVVLANSEYRHELESNIEPFKGLLLGLFFITVGAGIDVDLLFDQWGVIFAATLAVILIKFGVLFALGKLFRLRGGDHWLFALSLAQAGEFGFVLLSFSLQNSVLPLELGNQLLLVVALSMLLTPVLFIVLERLIMPRQKSQAEETRPADEISERSPIIIAGHGRVGQIVNRILEMSGYQPTVIDIDIDVTEGLTNLGFKTYFGDAVRPELLEAAGIEEASVLVIAIDDKRRALELASHVSREYPDLTIVARAHDRPHTYDLYQAGVRGPIVRETFDSSVRLGWGALEALGYESEVAKETAQIFFDRDRQLVFEAAELHDPEAARYSNKQMIEKARQMDSETAVMMQDVLKPKA